MKAAILLAVPMALATCAAPAYAEMPPPSVVIAACDQDVRAKISRREPTAVRALSIVNRLTAHEAATVQAVCSIYELGVVGAIRMMAEPRA